MSSSNNNFIATIVEQTGSDKHALLSNDAPTIVEKFKSPSIKSESKPHVGRYAKSGGSESTTTVKSETVIC